MARPPKKKTGGKDKRDIALSRWLSPDSECGLMRDITAMRDINDGPMEPEHEELISWAEEHYAREIALFTKHQGNIDYHGGRWGSPEPCPLNR